MYKSDLSITITKNWELVGVVVHTVIAALGGKGRRISSSRPA
jgi:uncharacterized membrane protein YuzA (DUF378 family)